MTVRFGRRCKALRVWGVSIAGVGTDSELRLVWVGVMLPGIENVGMLRVRELQ